MNAFHHRLGALLAMGIGMAAAAPAFADLSIVTRTCAMAGRNPFANTASAEAVVVTTYSCGVAVPDDLTSRPPWRHLKLQYRDRTGSLLVARLIQKSRTSGAERVVATLTSTPSTSIKVISAALSVPLDLALYGYYVRVDATAPAEPHMVMLTNK